MTSPLGRVYTTKVEPLPHEPGWLIPPHESPEQWPRDLSWPEQRLRLIVDLAA